MDNLLDEARLEYFYRNSQSRFLRRRMAKKLGAMKQGWQNVKDEFPPYNKPNDLGINKFKKTINTNKSITPSQKRKAVINYKSKVRAALSDQLNKEK